MSLSIASPSLAIPHSRLADGLRRMYAVGLIALALSGWSPVVWHQVQAASAATTEDVSDKKLDVRQASFEVSVPTPEVSLANYIQ